MSKDGESESQLQIKVNDSRCETFIDESLIFTSINETLDKKFIEVYALVPPVQWPYNKEEKDNQINTWKNEILQVLNNN